MGGVWFLPVHLPIGHDFHSHHNHHNNHNHCVVCYHNYNAGLDQLHSRHIHHRRLQHLRLQLHRTVRLQHPHLHRHHIDNDNNHNNNDNNNHSSSFNLFGGLRTCSRPVLCLSLHIRRHHLLRLCRVGLRGGEPGQALVQHQG